MGFIIKITAVTTSSLFKMLSQQCIVAGPFPQKNNCILLSYLIKEDCSMKHKIKNDVFITILRSNQPTHLLPTSVVDNNVIQWGCTCFWHWRGWVVSKSFANSQQKTATKISWNAHRRYKVNLKKLYFNLWITHRYRVN